jgi:hypothetical protein
MKTFYQAQTYIQTKLFIQTWNQAGDHIWNQLLFHLVSELESNLESQINESI